MGRCRKTVLCIDLKTDFQHEKKEPATQILFGCIAGSFRLVDILLLNLHTR